MRAVQVLLCALAAFATSVAAADPDPNVVPACANTCTESALKNQTACASTDLTCLCSSQEFNGQVTQCVQASCTVKESLIATKLSFRQCGVEPNGRDQSIIPIRTTFLVIATVLIFIRLFNKFMGYSSWWWDDYTIIPAYAMAVCMFAGSVLLYNDGLGIDIWDLSFYNITSFFHAFYFISLVYKIEMAFAKISVCLFFLRIFPAKNFRVYTTCVIILNAIVGLAFFCLDAFQCSPINGAWKGWAKEDHAKCLDLPVSVYTNGFFNIALDVIMISLPIYEVWKLKLPITKKLSAAVMFGMGFLLTIIGILRNVNYSKHMRTSNPTSELAVLHRWAVLEVDISVICACLPDIRLLLVHIIRYFRGPTTSTSKKGYYSDENRTKASHITVTSTFKTDYEFPGKTFDDTESQVELVDVLRAPRPTKSTVKAGTYLDTAESD